MKLRDIRNINKNRSSLPPLKNSNLCNLSPVVSPRKSNDYTYVSPVVSPRKSNDYTYLSPVVSPRKSNDYTYVSPVVSPRMLLSKNNKLKPLFLTPVKHSNSAPVNYLHEEINLTPKAISYTDMITFDETPTYNCVSIMIAAEESTSLEFLKHSHPILDKSKKLNISITINI